MCTSDAYGHVGDHTEDNDTIHSSDPSLEADSDDRDSALGDNQSSYTMSVTSSVYNFRYEHGRRYHAYAEGKYPLPNDEVEKDRLDLQHQAFRLTLDGKLYLAPIEKDLQHALDIGCGTGIWTIEFADDHPSASVIGTDLSPIQPSSVPPNCSFLIDDVDQDWIFHYPFDYIHTRALVAAVKNWDRMFEQAYANLRPGGYLECQELSFPIMCLDSNLTPETSPLLRWGTLFLEAAAQTGLDGTVPARLGSKLRAAGFVDIHRKNFKWPLGTWAKGRKNKLLGHYVLEDYLDFLPGSVMGLFTRVLKWTREEVELFLSECRKEIREQKERHFYFNLYIWVARKPENATTANYDHNEVVRDDSPLEADDRPIEAPEQAVEAPKRAAETPIPQDVPQVSRVNSPGALVQPTADLALGSPLSIPVQDMKDASPSPSPSSDLPEERRAMPSLNDILNQPEAVSNATTESNAATAPTDASSAPSSTSHAQSQPDAEKTEEGAQEEPADAKATDERVKVGMPAFSGNFLGGF